MYLSLDASILTARGSTAVTFDSSDFNKYSSDGTDIAQSSFWSKYFSLLSERSDSQQIGDWI